jgi:excisionase family DNA binding protein
VLQEDAVRGEDVGLPPPVWESVAEAAKLHGVTTQTIRNWAKDGRIRACRIGPRLIRVAVNDIVQPLDRDAQ